jgi:hypothetical protein
MTGTPFRCLLVLARAVLLGSISFSVFAANVSKPNVVLIYTDDQGSLDLNCYGSKDPDTPHLDQLASHGAEQFAFLRQGYLASSRDFLLMIEHG